MVGTGANDPDIDSVFLIPASVSIHNVDAVPCVEVIYCSLTVDFPYLMGLKELAGVAAPSHYMEQTGAKNFDTDANPETERRGRSPFLLSHEMAYGVWRLLRGHVNRRLL